MRVVWLAWYICGMCVLLVLLGSLITWHPEVRHWALLLTTVLGAIGLLAGGTAVWLGRLPPTHPIHQSKPLWAGCVAVAATVTLLLVFVG